MVHNESLKAVGELRRLSTRKVDDISLQQMRELFNKCIG